MIKKLIFLILLCVTHLAFAEGIVKPLNTDTRSKSVLFVPDQIYMVKTQYLISTDIIFSNDENIVDYHLGDASSWDIETSGNHLFIKAKKIDASGNLNVVTNLFSYHFILNVSDKESDQTVLLKVIYPKGAKKAALESIMVPADLCQDARKYNLHYSFTGNHEQAPIQACDDGLFTYFKFRKQIELPAAFVVLPDRNEQVVNYHMEKGYMVIERVAKAFTFRNGNTVTSVYNDDYIGDWDKVKH